MRTRMQQGGTTEEQVMQLIQMYAQITGSDPQEIMNELQQMSPQEQGQAIQQIGQAVQSYMSEEQGQQMARGGITGRPGVYPNGYSGTYDASTGSYFSHGGSYGRRLPRAQGGIEIPPRPEPQDYPDYGSFKAADDDWVLTYGDGAINVPALDQQIAGMPVDVGYENPAATILASGSPMAPIPVPTAAVTTTASASTEHPADYNYSIVNYLNDKGMPSSYNTRKDIAKILNISNYRGKDYQNLQMLDALTKNPTLLQTIIGGGKTTGKGSGNSTGKAIDNLRRKAKASGAIVGGGPGGGGAGTTGGGSGVIAPPIVNRPDSTGTFIDSTGTRIDSTGVKIDSTGRRDTIPNPYGFNTDTTGAGGRPDTIIKPKPGKPFDWTAPLAGLITGAGLAYLGALQQGPVRAKAIMDVLSQRPEFTQASDNLKRQALEKATSDIEATYQWYKKLPKEQRAILDNLDAMEIAGHYPGEDIGDPAARAEALFAEQEAIQERQAMSRYADAEATAANAEALAEQNVLNETALRRAGASPTRAKRIAKNQAATQAMLDEAAAEEAVINRAAPKPTTAPSLRERLMANIKRKGSVGRPSAPSSAEVRGEAARPEVRGEAPSEVGEMSRLGQAGKFLRGLFREVGKREYGGSGPYIPDYSMAYGGAYQYNGGGEWCTDPQTGESIPCNELKMRQMNSSAPYYSVNPSMGMVGSIPAVGQINNPYYNMNPNMGSVRMNPYRQAIPTRNIYYNKPVPSIPRGMYGMGMAKGGQMPQWLAQRRFAAAGNQDMMSDYGYQQGGVVEVNESNLPQVLQQLKQGGYQFEIMR